LPLEEYYKFALGVLKLSPSAFRAMSMVEFSLAVEGYLESKGIDKKGFTWSDVEDFAERHNIPERTYSIRVKD